MRLSYIETKTTSFLHSLDAVSKFSQLVAVAFLAFFITNVWHELILFATLCVLLQLGGKISVRNILYGMLFFLPFCVIMMLMQIIFYQGPSEAVIFQLGFIRLNAVAIQYGVLLGVRVLVVGISALSFVMTTEPRRMVYDMTYRLKIPYRFAFGFYAMIKFIPIFEDEGQNILNAQAVRGAQEFERGLSGAFKKFKRLVIPLLISGLKKAKTSAIAMDTRAFGAYPHRTSTYAYGITWKSYVFGILPWVIFLLYLLFVSSIADSWTSAYGGFA